MHLRGSQGAILDHHAYYHAMHCTSFWSRATDQRPPDRTNRIPSRNMVATLAIRLQGSETQGVSTVRVAILILVCAGSSICQWYSRNLFRQLMLQKLFGFRAMVAACSTPSQSRFKLLYQAQQLAQNPSSLWSQSYALPSRPVAQQHSTYLGGCVARLPSLSGSPRVAS